MSPFIAHVSPLLGDAPQAAGLWLFLSFTDDEAFLLEFGSLFTPSCYAASILPFFPG